MRSPDSRALLLATGLLFLADPAAASGEASGQAGDGAGAQADAQAEAAPPDAPEARPGIDEVAVARIDFRGSKTFDDARLRRVLKRARRRDEGELAALTAFYRDQGFKDVEVGEPEASGSRLTVPIREGGRWNLGGLTVRGNRIFGDLRLIERFEGRRGGWLRASDAEAWAESVRDLYRADGRPATRVSWVTVERPGQEADLVLSVTEGEQLRLGRLEIEGNTRTREKVLRRAVGIDEGEVLDLVALREGLARAERQGLFDFDDEDPVKIEGPAGESGAVDVTLVGREVDPFQTGFGGGWSKSDGLSAHLSLETPNFLGRGEAAGVRLQTGGPQDGWELFYSVPWFLDRPQSLGFELFERDTDFEAASDQRQEREEQGGSLSWARFLGRRQSLRLIYTRSELEDRRSRTEEGVVLEELSRRQSSSLRSLWIYDSRDDPLDPRSGLRAWASLEVAGGALGGDNRFWRPRLGLALFRPLGRRAFGASTALRFEAGWIDSPAGETLSPLETFFLGGPGSLRGFATRSIAVREADGSPALDELGFRIGGTRYFETGAELRLPLAGALDLVLFADAGDVWTEGRSTSLSRLRSSAGAELRLTLPKLGVPLRLIWARNLDPLPGDRFDAVQIRFGPSF